MTTCPWCGDPLALVPDELGGEPEAACVECDVVDVEAMADRLGQLRLQHARPVETVAVGAYL